MKKFFSVASAAALLLGSACNNLDVTNPNNPDVARALASPEDVKNISISTMNSWYLTSTYVEPYISMCVTADACSGNFGNFGMRFNNLEPRIPYGNNSAGGDRGVTENPWNFNYQTLGAANDALRAYKGGISLGSSAETAKFKAIAQFTQAASLMNLALIFDRAFVVDETFDATAGAPELVPYGDVSKAAAAKFDQLIADLNGKNETYDKAVIPTTVALTSNRLQRFANSMEALLLAYTPRKAAEVGSVDWAKVAALADKGIGTGSAGAPFDFIVQGDFTTWLSYIAYYEDEKSWVYVDQRLIHRMDPSIPEKFNGTIVPRGTSPDARYLTDFGFQSPVVGDPSRGIYMQSPFYHLRYVSHARLSTPTNGRTPVPYLLAAESDLVRAEALIRKPSPDLATAAALINNSRVTRGHLPPATAGDGVATLLSYIDYEREIELHATSGFTLFQRRHVDGLQPGTYRHLPIPAKELETLALPIYTFGGVGQPDMNILLPDGTLSALSSAPKLSRAPLTEAIER